MVELNFYELGAVGFLNFAEGCILIVVVVKVGIARVVLIGVVGPIRLLEELTISMSHLEIDRNTIICPYMPKIKAQDHILFLIIILVISPTSMI